MLRGLSEKFHECFQTHKVLNFRVNLVQHFAYAKNWLLKNMPDLTNMPNQKYLCQPLPRNAKLQKFSIKICQLATLILSNATVCKLHLCLIIIGYC